MNNVNKTWILLKENVYETIREKGLKWFKSDYNESVYQLRALRRIFNIPLHIPDEQIKDFIEHKRKGGE